MRIIFSILATALIFLSSSLAWAGGCKLTTVSTAKELVANYIAGGIRDKVISIEKKMNARGERLEAVLVARAGEDMGQLRLIKDNPNRELGDLLYDYARIAHKASKDEESNESITSSNQTSQLPRQYYSNERLVYSHLGILLKKNPRKAANDPNVKDWVYVIHLLAECDKKSNRYGNSSIFVETFNQFFWDAKTLEAKGKNKKARNSIIVVPKQNIQRNIYTLSQRPEIADDRLHEPNYNVISVPFRFPSRAARAEGKASPSIYQLKDQNSNQWPLEIIAAALKPYGHIKDRRAAQNLLKQTNYRPSLATPTGLKGTMACDLKRGPFGLLWDATNLINCDDQVYRNEGIVQVITVKSVIDYMKRNNFLAASVDHRGRPGIYTFQPDAGTIEAIRRAAKTTEKVMCSRNPEHEQCKLRDAGEASGHNNDDEYDFGNW